MKRNRNTQAVRDGREPKRRSHSFAGKTTRGRKTRTRLGARREVRAGNGADVGVRCSHYPRCYGCVLVGRPYTEQLKLKLLRVQAAVTGERQLGTAAVLPVIGSRSTFGYRNQAKLVLRGDRAGVLAGLYIPGTHAVSDASACPVHHPTINRIVARVLSLLVHHEAEVYEECSGKGILRYLVVRYSFWQRRSQVILVAARRAAWLAGFARALRRSSRGLANVMLNINPTRGNVIFGREWSSLGGEDGIVERFGTVKLKARSGSFLQANPWVATRLYRTVERWMEARPEETMVDLYAGVGGIAITAAPSVARVFAIEENASAASDARGNARRNGISNCRVLQGTVETILPRLRREVGTAAVVTMNPPRKGVSADVIREVAALGPRLVLYLSCDPDTLARDLGRLRASGYATERIQPADMLPQTEHVECLALARRVG